MVEFAVSVDAVARPLAFVVAVYTVPLLVPLAKVPPAPEEGAVKVTVTPLTGLESLSKTVATNEAVNADPAAALCGVPLVAAIEDGGPGVLVKLKAAAVETPDTDAETT
jgi:hypothetical protein